MRGSGRLIGVKEGGEMGDQMGGQYRKSSSQGLGHDRSETHPRGQTETGRHYRAQYTEL